MYFEMDKAREEEVRKCIEYREKRVNLKYFHFII